MSSLQCFVQNWELLMATTNIKYLFQIATCAKYYAICSVEGVNALVTFKVGTLQFCVLYPWFLSFYNLRWPILSTAWLIKHLWDVQQDAEKRSDLDLLAIGINCYVKQLAEYSYAVVC